MLVSLMCLSVPVPTSHKSLRLVLVLGFWPPNKIVCRVTGSKTPVCEKRASGPYCVQVCAFNSAPDTARKLSRQTSEKAVLRTITRQLQWIEKGACAGEKTDNLKRT